MWIRTRTEDKEFQEAKRRAALARGMRRLDTALSNAPLNNCDKPGSRQSPAAKEIFWFIRQVGTLAKKRAF